MKWIRLFKTLKHFLLYETDIDLRTTKLLLNIFVDSISITNYNRFKTELDYVLAFTNKQVSLHKTLQEITTNNLDKEFKKLNGEKPK